jgi:hypothetical protein
VRSFVGVPPELVQQRHRPRDLNLRHPRSGRRDTRHVFGFRTPRGPEVESKALIVAGIYLLAHQLEGNVIEPLVMARAVELHPALVAIGVIAVERLFGFIGLIVAVPILVTVKILVEELWVRPLETAHGGPEPPDEAPPATGRWRMHRARRPVETGPAD